MKLLAILTLSLSMLVACGGATEEPAPEPEAVEEPAPAPEPLPSHPEIMQEVSETRPVLQENIEGGNAEAAAAAATRLEELFTSAIPVYESRGLDGAIEMAMNAAAAAGEAAAAAEAGDLAAAATAHATVQEACQGCHSQYREKAPDGSYQFKAQ